MTNTRTTILLSHERSGSHLLGEFLGSLGNVAMFDEVCNPDAVVPANSPMSFFRFRYEAIQRDATLLLEPSRKGHEAFVTGFFRHLHALRRNKSIAVDIKYGHVHNFELYWWPVFERPFLMKVCEDHDIGVVHLFRQNVVEAAASAMIADARRVWHSWEAAAPKTADRTFTLSAQAVMRRAKQLERQILWYTSALSDARKLTVTYEQLARELGQGGMLDTEIAEFAGGILAGAFQPRHQKVTRPLPEVIENYAEVKAACEAAGLGRHLV